MRRSVLLAGIALSLLVAACGSDGDDGDSATKGQEGSVEELEHSLGVGAEAADPTDANRLVEIQASDDFRFQPDEISLRVGEIVTFRVTNVGKLPHEFALGVEALQDEHEAEMAEMGGTGMHAEPNAFSLAAGETKEMTWHFPQTGEFLMGCHVPGHYAAGMRGVIQVEG